MDPTSNKGDETGKRTHDRLAALTIPLLSLLFAGLSFLLQQPYSQIAVIFSPTLATLLVFVWPRVWFRYQLHWHIRKLAMLEKMVANTNLDLSEESRKAIEAEVVKFKTHLLDLQVAASLPTHEAKSAAWLEAQSRMNAVGSKILEVLTIDDQRLLKQLSDEQKQDLAVKQALEKLDPA